MGGFDKDRERKSSLNLLGKDLARRARSRCELCESAGVRLYPFEPEPVPREPALETTIMICEPCAAAANGGELGGDGARFLESVAWSETLPIQVTAIRLLRRLADREAWAREALDVVYLSPEAEAWLSED